MHRWLTPSLAILPPCAVLSRPPQRPTLTSDDVQKRGYLTKQGRVVKSWKKRYFVIRNGSLFYYKSPEVRLLSTMTYLSMAS